MVLSALYYLPVSYEESAKLQKSFLRKFLLSDH